MGMMKEHVRGPIKCCETIASDVLQKTRAEELVFNPQFKAVDLNINIRKNKDLHGGATGERCLGVPVSKTDDHVLNRLLRDLLMDAEVGGGWESDDYGHEDLVIEEYTKAIIGTKSFFTVDWNRDDGNATANYFILYNKKRNGRDVSNRDSGEPIQPSMADLESLDNPPADFIKEMSDYYYHQYIGQVKL